MKKFKVEKIGYPPKTKENTIRRRKEREDKLRGILPEIEAELSFSEKMR